MDGKLPDGEVVLSARASDAEMLAEIEAEEKVPDDTVVLWTRASDVEMLAESEAEGIVRDSAVVLSARPNDVEMLAESETEGIVSDNTVLLSARASDVEVLGVPESVVPTLNDCEVEEVSPSEEVLCPTIAVEARLVDTRVSVKLSAGRKVVVLFEEE